MVLQDLTAFEKTSNNFLHEDPLSGMIHLWSKTPGVCRKCSGPTIREDLYGWGFEGSPFITWPPRRDISAIFQDPPNSRHLRHF